MAAVCLGSLVGAATAGTQTPAAETVGRLGSTENNLDYSKDQAGRLRPLSPDFIAQNLGLNFAASDLHGSPSLSVGPSLGSGTLLAAGPAINPVSTPVLQCVNGHQTADPLSPPCVSQFTGDNGGSTYRGVNRNEVRVVVRFNGQFTAPEEAPPQILTPFDTLVDLDDPAPKTESFRVRNVRLYAKYFNAHYQLFGRRVHFYVYFDTDQVDRGAVNWGPGEATDIIYRVQPFAVVQLSIPDSGGFIDTVMKHGAVGFLPGLDLRERQQRSPELLWSYEPAVERLADQYVSYLCTKVVPNRAVLSGEPGQNGHARRFGMYHGDASAGPLYQRLYDLVLAGARRCGANVVADATFPSPRGCGDAATPGLGNSPFTNDVPPQPYALDAITRFRAAGVTTVLWPGCVDFNIGPAAAQLNYKPEWVLAGDGQLDNAGYTVGDRGSLVAFDHRALVVTPATLLPNLSNAQCYQAQRDADPSLPATYPPGLPEVGLPVLPTEDQYAQALVGCYEEYAPLRQLFTAIQLAGPRLSPSSLSSGLRSLAYFPSPDPQTPSCYYGGDNSCVQDAIAEYWDASKLCWRAIEGARRYLPNAWPAGNVDAQIHNDEPCNYGSA